MARVIHTRALFWAHGMAVTPQLILIHPSRRGDQALLAHENTHCQQMLRDGLLRWYGRYVFNRAWRLAYEVEAYREQIKLVPWLLDEVSHGLAKKYLLGLDARTVKSLLSGAGKETTT